MVRIAVIEKEKCNPTKCGNYLCIRLCPINREGKDCIVIGDDKKAKINEAVCTGCGICPNRCPYGAIHIINLPEAIGGIPVHRYGENGFALYNIPIPIFGKVVGILGVNGIGKSTAIKVLAGVLKPNMGKDEAGINEVIRFFKGSQAQLFFERLKRGDVKISYKPQNVDIIQKIFDGKVIDLLKRADEKGMFDEIVEKFELRHVLENNIKKISGGELQRLAIAATIMKKANFYVFDEPSSFLDIKQRIRIAKVIKGLANENTAVMVVEHDLIMLDYMTDQLHLMYGEENAYGVVSFPKATRQAINTYLSGYLREENIRFRGTVIKFEAKQPFVKKGAQHLISWKDIFKKLGNFEIRAPLGDISKNHVIGILGENGIGKTSFVKILAGVIKQDSGEITENIKVSYKPQYLEPSDILVSVALEDAEKRYHNQIISPLDLEILFDKRLNELSGGQLQRVAIASCLAKDADLYLLDEPSANLDVEQRLRVSKVIKDMMEHRYTTALVVDHDLLFADYISNMLIVFSGVPARNGTAEGPFGMEEGMNKFLNGLDITLRRDIESRRPRINKEESRLDREQKEKGKFYYN